MKYAFLVPAIAVLAFAALPASAQRSYPGDGNPGAWIHSTDIQQNAKAPYDPRHNQAHLTPDQRSRGLRRGREMLQEVKQQIAEAGTDEERQALLERKREIENAMIQVQQAN